MVNLDVESLLALYNEEPSLYVVEGKIESVRVDLPTNVDGASPDPQVALAAFSSLSRKVAEAISQEKSKSTESVVINQDYMKQSETLLNNFIRNNPSEVPRLVERWKGMVFNEIRKAAKSDPTEPTGNVLYRLSDKLRLSYLALGLLLANELAQSR